MRHDVLFAKSAAAPSVGKKPTADEMARECNPRELDPMIRASLACSRWMLPLLLAAFALACGHGKSSPSGLTGGGSDTGREPPAPINDCATPQAGCPCTSEAEVVECGSVVRHSGD